MTINTRIGSIRRFISMEACTTLVLILCISDLDYGNSLLYRLPKNTIDKYQLKQKLCAKLKLQESKYDILTDALCRLHWLWIKQCTEFKILVLTYKCIHGNTQKYLQDGITIRKPNHQRDITYIQTSMEPY